MPYGLTNATEVPSRMHEKVFSVDKMSRCVLMAAPQMDKTWYPRVPIHARKHEFLNKCPTGVKRHDEVPYKVHPCARKQNESVQMAAS